MKPRLDFDGAVKEILQLDRPVLLDWVTRGAAIREFLTVELPKVLRRRADMVFRLEDHSRLHMEVQARNDKSIGFRMGIYHLLLAEADQRPIARLRHVVFYIGAAPLRMPSRLFTGPMTFEYEVIDIREVDAGVLLASDNPADYALAILAGGGVERMGEIFQRIAGVEEPARERALTQLVILCGLRKVPAGRLEMELSGMGVIIDVNKNPFLKRLVDEYVESRYREGIALGEQKGEQKGMQKGKQALLRLLIKTKFGRVPKWASDRLAAAQPAELENWATKILTANALEDLNGLGENGPR